MSQEKLFCQLLTNQNIRNISYTHKYCSPHAPIVIPTPKLIKAPIIHEHEKQKKIYFPPDKRNRKGSFDLDTESCDTEGQALKSHFEITLWKHAFCSRHSSLYLITSASPTRSIQFQRFLHPKITRTIHNFTNSARFLFLSLPRSTLSNVTW